MADRGRKKLPRGMKVLDAKGRPDAGTRGKHARGDLPEPPEWMPEIAQEFWREVAPILEGMGVGTEGDKWSLETMSMLYWQWRSAVEVVKAGGESFICERTKNPKRRPEAVAVVQCAKELRMMFNEVGLTPAARAKVAPKGDDKSDNPFAAFA